MRKYIRSIFFVGFFGLTVWSGYRLCKGAITYYNNRVDIEATANIAASYTEEVPLTSEEDILHTTIGSTIDIEALNNENPDTVGYIEIPDTKISYPVLRNDEDGYYFKRNFKKEPNISGSIYIDNACYKGGSNILLYGHNMKDGSMFGGLKKFLDADYLKKHSKMQLTTENGIYIYDILGVFTASGNDESLWKVLVPYTEAEFDSLMQIFADYGVQKSTDGKFGDKYITLVTCEYTHKNGRLFLIGKESDYLLRKD